MPDNIVTTQKDDVEALADQARAMLLMNLNLVNKHFADTWNKSSCSVTVEFQRNKDEEIIIKVIPKTVMPLDTEEMMGEYSDSGELRLI